MVLTREVPATIETVTPIKPSEALRLGRLVRPERTMGLFFGTERGACAVGAMCVGWGDEPEVYPDGVVVDESLRPTFNRLQNAGLNVAAIERCFDEAERAGEDGDAAVLAYLEGLGL